MASSFRKEGKNMNYFKIGNMFFSLKLSPAEAMTFCAVSSIQNSLAFAVCSAASISRRTGLSVRTVYRALEGIQNKGLVRKKKKDTAMTGQERLTAITLRILAVDSLRWSAISLNISWMRPAFWSICIFPNASTTTAEMLIQAA